MTGPVNPTWTECPYKDSCPGCPGGGDWIPTKGFRLTPEGLLCLDWDITIPLEEPNLPPEGRHFAGLDAADKMDVSRRTYSRGPKRRTAQKKYEESEGGQATTTRYMGSDKARLTRQKYIFSEKGQETLQKGKDTRKLYRRASRWLRNHPGKTLQDFLATQDTPDE